jgi:hypothetical protein
MSTVAFHESLVDQTIALSDGAFRLYVDAVCWVVRQRTAGVVSSGFVRTRVVPRSQYQSRVDELVASGLFVPVADGWRVAGPWHVASGQRERIPEGVRSAIYERDGYQCQACGSTDDLTLDHIYPRSRAGSDGSRNLQTLCGPCNSRKGARLE